MSDTMQGCEMAADWIVARESLGGRLTVGMCYRVSRWADLDPLVRDNKGALVWLLAETQWGYAAPEVSATETPASTTESKPTNPKDAIGIRKAPFSVLPFNVLAELGVALLEGASKYGRHNYRGVGVRASVYYDATLRHLGAWWEGEDTDPDSEMSHVTKAISSLIVLRDAMMQGKCEDDRPPRSVPFAGNLNELAGAVLDRHAGKNPKHWTIADDATPEPVA